MRPRRSVSCAKLLKKFSKLLVHCEMADQKSRPCGLPSGHDAPPPWTVSKPFCQLVVFNSQANSTGQQSQSILGTLPRIAR